MTSKLPITPRNVLGVQIPLAGYGAAQLPIPQPATVGEANSIEFAKKLRAVERAQIEANAVAATAARQREFSQPYAATARGQVSPATAAESTPADEFAAGAAAAREAMQTPAVSLMDCMRERHGLAPSSSSPAAEKPKHANGQDEFDRGAAAARETLQAAGQGSSLADRMRALHGTEATATPPALSLVDVMRDRHGLPTAEKERGAAEATALLKIAGR